MTIECLPREGKIFSKTVDMLANEMLLTQACSQRTTYGAVIEDYPPPAARAPEGPVGISITTDGMPGSIAAFGLRYQRRAGEVFFSSVAFSDPRMPHSSTTVFAGVPVGPSPLLPAGWYAPSLSMANFSSKKMHVEVEYARTSGSAPTANQVLALDIPAGSSRQVALRGLPPNPQLQDSVLISSGGAPGDLVARLASFDPSIPGEIELPAKDAEDSNNGGSNPWSIANGMRSTLIFFNHDQSPVIFNVLIATSRGAQWQRDFKVVPMQTRAISIGGIIRNKVKDGEGRTLPLSALSGQISWWTVGTKTGPGTGRLLLSDPVIGMVRSFACGCPYIVCGADPSTVAADILVNTTDSPAVALHPIICLYKSGCTGTTSSEYSSQALSYSWSSSDTSVAQVSGSSTGSSVNVYGASVGGATMNGKVSATYYSTYETCTFYTSTPTNVLSVNQSPSQLNMSTGDTTKQITVSVSPSTVSVTTTFSGTSSPTSNPDGSGNASLAIQGNTGSGSISSYVTVPSTDVNYSGDFTVTASASGALSSNSTTVNVPPQVLIQMMQAEAGGTGNNTAMQSLGDVAQNRIHSSLFDPPIQQLPEHDHFRAVRHRIRDYRYPARAEPLGQCFYRLVRTVLQLARLLDANLDTVDSGPERNQ